ncbi:hypothetical protein GCM10011367_16060 [Marinicauda pacifica]|jgi:uncharacterized membrane protein YhhN|uniref:Lysoplasmalogenase n=2 Tax=Marinicauda pacifica TaxID=1133559 RepID=A0A4S2HBG6_9PROT|nr:lysoplasmalogenase [Marinicauda sp. Alg238-R41]TGY93018.1 lysoplasmalogenase [Marinicauda pacifica]GGE42164.1 hypothetical protein GCM10011367_16060 [Marinicauda pacifica]
MEMSGDTKAGAIPGWAAPAYLATALLCLAGYWVIDMAGLGVPGSPIIKASGIVMLGLFALMRRAPVLALALFLSAIGDYSLEIRGGLEIGIAAFASAHAVYLGLFIWMIRREGWRRDGLVLAGALALYGAAMLSWLRPGMGDLAFAATLYNAIILVMAMASGLVKGPRLLAIGAVLFVISDSLLAAGWFKDVRPLAEIKPVWITYAAAQICLALGFSTKLAEMRQTQSAGADEVRAGAASGSEPG